MGRVRLDANPAGREGGVRVVIVVQRQPVLLQIVNALRAAGGFPRLLNGWQQQRNQHGNNGDDDEQFDQSERTTALSEREHIRLLSTTTSGNRTINYDHKQSTNVRDIASNTRRKSLARFI